MVGACWVNFENFRNCSFRHKNSPPPNDMRANRKRAGHPRDPPARLAGAMNPAYKTIKNRQVGIGIPICKNNEEYMSRC